MAVINILLFVIGVLFLGLFYLFTYKFNYWKRRQVPHIKPTILFGNYGPYITRREFIGPVIHKLCQQFQDAPFFGAYYGTEPALIVKDPDLLKLIMTKDFYYFHGREVTKYCKKEAITQSLFFSAGDQWRVARKNMTPLFSTAKMKNMFYLVEKCAKKFELLLDEVIKKNKDSIDARTLAARFTMSSIGTTVFGMDTRTLEEPAVNNQFTVLGDSIFDNTAIGCIKLVSRAIWPAIFYAAGLRVFPKSIDNFFNSLLTDVFKSRGYNSIGRNDFIDLLLNFKQSNILVSESMNNWKDGGDKTVEVEVTDSFLISQCVSMFAAGYETSSTTQAFVLYELAKNKEVQKRAQAEVDDFLKRHNNRLTYECTTKMTYLEACVDEALRLYPVLGLITREVVDDYTFPTGLKVEKELRIHIPVWHLHRNPDFFPEPEVYKPERFLPENKHTIKPYTYLPFGEGPRHCIGKRFGKLQVMVGLVTFLKAYSVELAEDMPLSTDFEPIALVTQPLHGIKLKFLPRKCREQRLFQC